MSIEELPPRQEQAYAYTIDQFCERYAVGRSFTYQQIKLGKLLTRKAGRRTLVRHEDAESWLNSLPAGVAAE